MVKQVSFFAFFQQRVICLGIIAIFVRHRIGLGVTDREDTLLSFGFHANISQ